MSVLSIDVHKIVGCQQFYRLIISVCNELYISQADILLEGLTESEIIFVIYLQKNIFWLILEQFNNF